MFHPRVRQSEPMQIDMTTSRNLPQLATGVSSIPLGNLHYGRRPVASNSFPINKVHERMPSNEYGNFQQINEQKFMNRNSRSYGTSNRFSFPNSSFNESSVPPYSVSEPIKQFSNGAFNFNNRPDITNKNDAAVQRANGSVFAQNSRTSIQNDMFPKSNSGVKYNAAGVSYITQQNQLESLASASQDVGKITTFKKNENERIRLFTGTAERVIKWHKVYNDYFCYYEVIGAIVSIQEGTVRLQKILLLRDRKGPIIQVVHYVKDHIKIENFFVGQMLRCVGRMVGPTTMHGLSIREASEDEIATLQRMCYISDHAITKALTKS